MTTKTEREHAAAREIERLQAPPPVQEPVAWLYKGDAEFDGKEWRDNIRVTTSKQVADWQGIDIQPLYTTPPAAPVPLTDEQHRENFEAWFRKEYHGRLDRNMPDKSYNSPHANATWIGWSAAHGIKEKNT